MNRNSLPRLCIRALVCSCFLLTATAGHSGPARPPVLDIPQGSVSSHWLWNASVGQWEPLGSLREPRGRPAGSVRLASSSGFPLSVAGGWQLSPAIACHAGRNEVLAVWEDSRNGTDLDVYGQRFAADGTLIGENFAVVIGEHDQGAPVLLYNPSGGGYLLLWHHRQRDDYGIYGQMLSALGTPLGTCFHVSWPRDGRQWMPSAVYNPLADEFLVVWEDMSTSAIVAQRISPKGEAVGGRILVSTRPKAQWDRPVVACATTSGHYLIAWDELAAGDIFAQVLGANGAQCGPAVPICLAAGQQFVSAVAYNDSLNEYLTVWTDERAVALRGSDIYAQRVATDGGLVGVEIMVSTATGAQGGAVAAFDAVQQEYVLVWWDARDERTGSDIYSRRISADGAGSGPEWALSTAITDQVVPCLAHSAESDRYAVVWEDWQAGEDGEAEADLYGLVFSLQRFSVWLPQLARGWEALAPSSMALAP